MRKLVLIALGFFIFNFSYAFETLLYVDFHARTDSEAAPKLLAELKPYSNKIGIFAPSVYSMTADGTVSHDLSPIFIAWARQSHIKLMPLVINHLLDQKLIHTFLQDPKAENKAIQMLLALCKKNNYYGIQLDFENIRYTDRDSYTQFVQNIARVFHQNHFYLTVAVVPPSGYDKPPTKFQTAMYENWVGGYDYAKLAQAADFISVMTYDHHTSETTPGAIASVDWMEQTIQFLLPLIPANKFSLGVPTYSGYWYTTMRNGEAQSAQEPLTYQDVQTILAQNHAKLMWDATSKTHYALFVNHSLNEYIFVEDAASFKAKYELARKYHLQGISIWQFSFADPSLWQVIPNRGMAHALPASVGS